MDKFYCFYLQPVGQYRMRAEFISYDEPGLQALLKKEAEGEIRDLAVIYGRKIEFEPVEVATKWKIKETE